MANVDANRAERERLERERLDTTYDQDVIALVDTWLAWKSAKEDEKEAKKQTLDAAMTTLADVVVRTADAATGWLEAAPIGCGVAAKALSSLLNALRAMKENQELVMLLAVDVALIWEMLRGTLSAEGADKAFYVEAAGKLHTAVLQSVSTTIIKTLTISDHWRAW